MFNKKINITTILKKDKKFLGRSKSPKHYDGTKKKSDMEKLHVIFIYRFLVIFIYELDEN